MAARHGIAARLSPFDIAAFPALLPGMALLVGLLALSEAPSLLQLAGLAIVLVGFRLTQMV